jgi:hypothetical protein
MWDNPQTYNQYLAEKDYKEAKASRMNTLSAGIERGNVEGQDRISFELSTAVGGRILNVRRYDQRKDYHDTQTYVIPSGEDVGARVAKIINLELIK